MVDPLPSLAFSTADAPPSDRAGLWQAHLPGYRCSPLGADDLRIAMRRTRVRGTEIVEVAGDSNLMERTDELIAAAPDETVVIGVLMAGRAFLLHAHEIDVLSPGDALIYDPGSAASYGRSDGFEELVLIVPRSELDRRTGYDESSRAPRVLRHDGTRGATVLDRARQVRAVIARRPADEDDIVAEVGGLLDALVGGGRPGEHWRAACDHIRRRLQDPLLSVASVAAAVGVSERQLARVFAERGSTVKETIMAERMRRAFDLVTDPTQQSSTIAEVARAVGFVSASHFSRAFRTAHGMSATDARRTLTAARR